MEHSMQKQNWTLSNTFLLTWHHSAKPHLSSLSPSKFLSDQAFEFWIIIPHIHWLATLWVEPISLLLARPWAPNWLIALAQLTTFRSVTANQHGPQSPRYSNCLQAKTTTILSQFWESILNLSVFFQRLWIIKINRWDTKLTSMTIKI